jgi:hypothetical protein
VPDLARARKPLEVGIEAVSFGSDTVAMFFRMFLAVPFLAYFSLIIGFAFPFIAVGLYALGWRLWPDNPNPKNEIMVGALWGGILLAISWGMV